MNRNTNGEPRPVNAEQLDEWIAELDINPADHVVTVQADEKGGFYADGMTEDDIQFETGSWDNAEALEDALIALGFDVSRL